MSDSEKTYVLHSEKFAFVELFFVINVKCKKLFIFNHQEKTTRKDYENIVDMMNRYVENVGPDHHDMYDIDQFDNVLGSMLKDLFNSSYTLGNEIVERFCKKD